MVKYLAGFWQEIGREQTPFICKILIEVKTTKTKERVSKF